MSGIGDLARRRALGILPVRRTATPPENAENHPAPSPALIRVLVVDHETLLRQGVKSIVLTASDVEVVGEATSSDEAINQAVALYPDVVVIESHLPDGAGVAAIRTIRQRCPQVRILVLSSRGDPPSFSQAAAAGAIGYILKDITSENLLNAIRAVFHRQTFLSPTIAQQMLQQFCVGGVLAESNGVHSFSRDAVALNPHDIEVLNRVAHGLSDKEIAAQLFLSEAAVKSRLRHIYRRLGLKNRAQAVVFALERGFLWSATGNPDRSTLPSFVANGAGESQARQLSAHLTRHRVE